MGGQYLAGICLDRGQKFYKTGQFDEAIRSFQFAGVFLPWRADLHCDLAYALNAKHRRAESATEAMIASKLAPGDKVIRERCLSLLERVGSVHDQVVTQFDDMLKQWPDDYSLKLRAAAGFGSTGNYNRAEQLYDEICRHDPKLDGVWLERARLLVESKSVARAIRILREAVREVPDNGALHYELAKLLLANGAREEATTELELSVKMDGAKDLDLADLLARVKSPEHARDIYVCLQREDNAFYVETLVNRTAHARLTLDTGASSCMLSRNVARKAKLDPKKGQLRGVVTASDYVTMVAIDVPEMSIGTAVEKNVQATVGDMPDNSDGLLGISFLKHYDFTVDTRHALLILQRRRSH